MAGLILFNVLKSKLGCEYLKLSILDKLIKTKMNDIIENNPHPLKKKSFSL